MVPARAAIFCSRDLPTLTPHRASVPLHPALLFPIVLAVAVAVTIASMKLKARRRYANLKVSGGRKALVMNLFNR